MPVLENARHELFAQSLAKGSRQVAALADSGLSYSEANTPSAAARLARRPDVKQRVAELLTDASMITKLDKAYIMSELQKTYDRATASEDYSACNKSLELLGKELGMFVDRHEIDVQLKRKVIVERLTEEQAAQMTALVRAIEDGGRDV